jgi:molecular chaperone GrpE
MKTTDRDRIRGESEGPAVSSEIEISEESGDPGAAGEAGVETSDVLRLKEDLQRAQDMYLRAMADFDNYRKRVERERASAARAGKREVLVRLLDVVDAFDRALKHMDEASESVRTGVQAIHRQLMSLLQSQGVTPFESLGAKFNPTLHEAIGAEETDSHAPDTVIDEVSRGYKWGDEVLRVAHVRVAK